MRSADDRSEPGPSSCQPAATTANGNQGVTTPAQNQPTLRSRRRGRLARSTYIIRSVAVEEMLHMTIACNLLNALGGEPAIDKPDFVPKFPGPLPFGIGDFDVHLRKCSIDQVRDVFMKIKNPKSECTFHRTSRLSRR